MDMSEVARFAEAEIGRRLRRGMDAWAVPEPMTLDQWAREHFYLSAESSYVEQRWTPWTFQRAIMACISNDDIEEVTFIKSARVGYTKMILAAMGYFADHKRRNQVVWQPTDDDAEDFVKSELDPMLRDVPVMRKVFPAYLARHKDNTLSNKKFVGSILRVRGGKAAKNYRRFSADVGYMDELDAFDGDVEKEGAPPILAAKRLEGATFPKFICGSTPKLKGFSLVEERFDQAEERFTFQIPCPHCGARHALTWGGKGEPHGFKWSGRDPDSVRHLCPHCGVLISQAEYLAVEASGVFINEDSTLWIDHETAAFTRPDGSPAPTPRHIGMHVWTAYSPVVSWSQIVREFFAALDKMDQGDDSKMKAWTNTTLGQTWEGEIERTDSEELKSRAEPFPLRVMPRDCLLLLCACDTQGNRIEAQVWGYGIGGQMWSIDHRSFFGNPAQEDVWRELEEFLFGETYQHASGTTQRIYATAIDSGGHHANEVYAFAEKHRARRVHAIKGSSGNERGIENGNTKVQFNWRGQRAKHGAVLWMVGTNLAKDRLASRLEISQPGPGYVHLSANNTDEWFRQLAGEDRVTVRSNYGTQTRWTKNRKRQEVIDMTAYAIWLEERLDLWSPRMRTFWRRLEEQVQPAIQDMFAGLEQAGATAEPEEPAKEPAREDRRPRQPAALPRPAPRGHSADIYKTGW